jgi:hypothetical protein
LFVHNGELVFDGTPTELRDGGGSLEQPFYRLTSDERSEVSVQTESAGDKTGTVAL